MNLHLSSNKLVLIIFNLLILLFSTIVLSDEAIDDKVKKITSNLRCMTCHTTVQGTLASPPRSCRHCMLSLGDLAGRGRHITRHEILYCLLYYPLLRTSALICVSSDFVRCRACCSSLMGIMSNGSVRIELDISRKTHSHWN